MKTLCNITDVITQTVTRGPSAGEVSKVKYSISGSKYSWGIELIRYKKDGSEYPPVGVAYYGKFSHILSCLKNVGDFDYKDVVSRIVTALENNTGIKMKSVDFSKSLEEIGKDIDNTFKCNYLNAGHNNPYKIDENSVYTRVLKASLKDKDED